MYGTTDIDQGLSRMGPPVVWKSADFVHWSFEGNLVPQIDWSKPYTFTDARGKTHTGYFRYWAPGKPIYRGGKYYLFPTIVKPDESLGAYAMVADKPEGPFACVNGDGLYFNEPDKAANEAKPIVNDIDLEILTDDDGRDYAFWRRRNAAIIGANWELQKGSQTTIKTKRSGYSEGPFAFKRQGIYYYAYTLSGNANYCYAYMMSKAKPLGGYNTPAGEDIFVHTDTLTGVWGPGHGNVFSQGDDHYYFAFLEYGEGGTTRQVFVNELHFNADGSIVPLKPDFNGVGALAKSAAFTNNLALAAKATASSHRPDKVITAQVEANPANPGANGSTKRQLSRTFYYTADKAVDNQNGTRWMAADTDTQPWYQLDFGAVKNLKTCYLYFVNPTLGHSWTLEKSTDGRHWQKVNAGLATAVIRSPEQVNTIGKARYLRVNITAGAAGLWEVAVY